MAGCKKEIEYLVFQEEIIYIRHLCGIDYQYSLEEVEIQNKEEPLLYALRDECNMIAATSGYRNELEREFGKQIFAHIDQHRIAESLGYNSYIELGYHIQGRQDYGTRTFQNNGTFYVFLFKYVCRGTSKRIYTKSFDAAT